MKKLGVGILAVLLLSASVHAATITVVDWGADPSTNGQVDWSAGSAAFTHARNFAGNSDVDVDFVVADGYLLTGPLTFHGTPSSSLASFSGAGGGSLTGTTTGSSGGGANTIDGADGAITVGFRSGGGAGPTILTLTGLTASTEYELMLYQANSGNNREATLSFDNIGIGDATATDVDRGNTKISIAYTTGTNTSVSLNITPEDSGHTWNWYAFSNETIVSVPEPSTSVLAALGLLCHSAWSAGGDADGRDALT